MIGLLLLIAGIAGLAVEEQFGGQTTIAIAVLVIGVVILAIQAAVFFKGASMFKRAWDDIGRF